MQKITTFLTYNDQAEEAANLYTSIFETARIDRITRSGSSEREPDGKVMSVTFTLNGQTFHALNGGPHFQFANGISLFVSCETQVEIDMYWEKLSEDGEKGPCGWLNDKFGVSWQIVPSVLGTLLQDKNPAKVQRVMAAMMTMSKMNIDALQKAASEVV